MPVGYDLHWKIHYALNNSLARPQRPSLRSIVHPGSGIIARDPSVKVKRGQKDASLGMPLNILMK